MIGKPSQDEINNILKPKNRKFVEIMPNLIPRNFEKVFPNSSLDGFLFLNI